MPFGLYPGKL